MNPARSVAAMLLVNRAGDLLLQRRSPRSPRLPGVWGVPGGHCEPGETPEQAVVRELWEEAGLLADPAPVLFERHVDAWTEGLVEHYFSAGTVAVQDDVVRNDDGIMIFVSEEEVLRGRQFTPGTADVLARFLRSRAYARLSSGKQEPYDGDRDDDERYAGWSYLGDRAVCPMADEYRSCHRRANLLLAQGRADALQVMIADGHRCAFVRLMELYVTGDRVQDLHAMAQAGDGRATFTLYQYLERRHQGDDLEAALRRYANTLPRMRIWLAGHIGADPARTDEALALVTPLLDDIWLAQEAHHTVYRINVTAGRTAPSTRHRR